jgi:type II secretory pathway component GspD/PulD (secretin)
MKKLSNQLKKNVTCKRGFGVAFFCACFFMLGLPAGGAPATGDEPVTLNVQDKPLGEVLQTISKETGYEFIIAKEWLDFTVSASFHALPLHKALKRIFGDLSNAIVYGADKKIKIIIYADTSSPETNTGKAAGQTSSKKKPLQRGAGQKRESPPSNAQILDNTESSESEQNASEETGQSGPTTDENSAQVQQDEPPAQEDTADSGQIEPATPEETEDSTGNETGAGNP